MKKYINKVLGLAPEKIGINDEQLVIEKEGQALQLEVKDIKEINFHYHAVNGVMSVWEFKDMSGDTLSVSGDAKGMDKVLLFLESKLASFNLEGFDRMLAEGDVVDSLCVWKTQ
ncbi:hypothetical protein [Pleionea sp. CnH1-48]|uniref:hypothetical protein n=1 Tax=Pleionea sp. CnH1-48 TaxID=2954494 RepID=UPI0020968F1E|nr:hypothetical protein [Pleionea sp. CnH1-48]MCO7224728.1 hypothetical protein [Pleionea sp. CnH1-48]